MDGGELVVSTATLIRIGVFLLYVPVCFLCYWRLFPGLSPTSKRLAGAMLGAQVLVLAVALAIQPSSWFESLLWELRHEWNIPSILASTQLALVGGIALITAWFAKARPAWQRLYLVGTGLVFLFLALDEYIKLHEYLPHWDRYYAALGAAVVMATMVVAARSPRHLWIWKICLLTGLAMSAVGGILLEMLPPFCGNLGLLRLDKCLYFFTWEEALEFLGIWLALVALLGTLSDAVPTPKPRTRLLLYLLPALWILLLMLYSQAPRLELRLLAQPASVQFESGVHLQGYRMNSRIGASLLQLYASARQLDYIGLGYSIHLVDQVSGDSVASHDKWAARSHSFWLFGPDYVPLYRQSMYVEIPPQTRANRALWVVLTLWRKLGDEYVYQEVVASDHQLLNESQVVLGELVLSATSVASANVPLAEFENGFTLDAVDMPERAQAGETLSIPISWRSDVPGYEDYMQFLHFGFEESGTWWVYDQQPLGPRLPTRLWYSGLADSEIWQVPLPADLAPGRYTVFTGLYSTADQERVSASDADGTPWLDARVPLGGLTIEK